MSCNKEIPEFSLSTSRVLSFQWACLVARHCYHSLSSTQRVVGATILGTVKRSTLPLHICPSLSLSLSLHLSWENMFPRNSLPQEAKTQSQRKITTTNATINEFHRKQYRTIGAVTSRNLWLKLYKQ